MTNLYVDVTLVVYQYSHATRMLLVDGHMQGTAATIVHGIDPGSLLKQVLHHKWLVAANKPQVIQMSLWWI